MTCINKNSVEYQALKNKSGIPEFILEAISAEYLEKYGRFPELDELPKSNSQPHLEKKLKLNHKIGKIDTILEATGQSTIEDATISINNEYRDLETSILPINETAIVDIKHRPSIYNLEEYENQVEFNNVNDQTFINQMLEKLAKLYGIKIIPITNAELQSDKWKGIVTEALVTNAFIYNGNIYINTSNASLDAPLHEMMHLLIGSIRFSNPTLYNELLSIVPQFTGYEQLIKTFKNRTRSDINEELLVTEFSKYLIGGQSILNKLDERVVYELKYNINRLLNSVLMGTDSVEQYEDTIYNMSLKELAKKVNSSSMNNTFKGSLEDAKIHRTLQNYKSELLESGKLKEYC